MRNKWFFSNVSDCERRNGPFEGFAYTGWRLANFKWMNDKEIYRC